MIHLDTNLLIASMDTSDAHHALARKVLAWPGPFAASAVAWTEYQSRPTAAPVTRALRGMLGGGIVVFDESVAVLAGHLLYTTQGRRARRLDTMIAATAILARAELATANTADFALFVAHGLKLFSLPEP